MHIYGCIPSVMMHDLAAGWKLHHLHAAAALEGGEQVPHTQVGSYSVGQKVRIKLYLPPPAILKL